MVDSFFVSGVLVGLDAFVELIPSPELGASRGREQREQHHEPDQHSYASVHGDFTFRCQFQSEATAVAGFIP
jgi:hypothetical protein